MERKHASIVYQFHSILWRDLHQHFYTKERKAGTINVKPDQRTEILQEDPPPMLIPIPLILAALEVGAAALVAADMDEVILILMSMLFGVGRLVKRSSGKESRIG